MHQQKCWTNPYPEVIPGWEFRDVLYFIGMHRARRAGNYAICCLLQGMFLVTYHFPLAFTPRWPLSLIPASPLALPVGNPIGNLGISMVVYVLRSRYSKGHLRLIQGILLFAMGLYPRADYRIERDSTAGMSGLTAVLCLRHKTKKPPLFKAQTG